MRSVFTPIVFVCLLAFPQLIINTLEVTDGQSLREITKLLKQ
jgi:hypothetical protein